MYSSAVTNACKYAFVFHLRTLCFAGIVPAVAASTVTQIYGLHMREPMTIYIYFFFYKRVFICVDTVCYLQTTTNDS